MSFYTCYPTFLGFTSCCSLSQGMLQKNQKRAQQMSATLKYTATASAQKNTYSRVNGSGCEGLGEISSPPFKFSFYSFPSCSYMLSRSQGYAYVPYPTPLPALHSCRRRLPLPRTPALLSPRTWTGTEHYAVWREGLSWIHSRII